MNQQPLDKILQTEARLRQAGGRVLRIFGTGLLTILPLGGTLIILALLGAWAYEWIGPGSRVGSLLVGMGLGVGSSDTLRYLVGVGMVCLGILLVGLLAELGFKKGFHNITGRIAKKIPLVKTIYETLGNFISLFSQQNPTKKSGMTPVWCSFGEEKTTVVLGLLATPEPLQIEGKSYYAVIIPTAPVPIGGGLFFMVTSRVQVAQEVGVEALASIYMSMGVTSPQFLSKVV
jgi:uncharacterized membrane protein